ncbi:MAG: ThiF family adenylyltransferase [Candidatus Thorarchaeota archaeon]
MTENKEDVLKSRIYARQQLIDGWDQATLEKACLMIVGVGALGCEVAKDFALMGIGKLILVDLDTIETSNLSRQMLFKPGDEGRPKAEVAAERLKEMNPYLKVDFYFEKLQKLPMSVFEESEVVIAALDNFNARLDLNKICLRLKIPIIEAGTVGFEGHVQIIIPKGSGIEYKDKATEIENLVESKMWELDTPEFKEALREIDELEQNIERIKQNKIEPIREQIRKQVEVDFDAKYAENVLNITPCYRCLVPIPPADDKLIAACTLKGLPRNRNHCVIKAEVDFEKKYGFKPDMNMDEDVLKLKQIAQEELEKLRHRVFNENVPPEKLKSLSFEEVQEWENNIKDTFGPDFKFEEMENILGNKIAAIQSVSSVIASIQSQEALKMIFRLHGRNIGAPMDPPYVNYNGVYGQFDHLNIIKREDCLACGKIEGEENIKIVVPFDADIGYIFKALRIIGHSLEPILWIITNPTSKEIYWNPYIPSMKDPNIKLTALKIRNNDIITLTPLGKAKVESDIKKYNVIITYM